MGQPVFRLAVSFNNSLAINREGLKKPYTRIAIALVSHCSNVLACHVIAIILTAYLRGIDRKNVETAKNTQQHQFHGKTREKILGIIANRKQSPANIVTFS